MQAALGVLLLLRLIDDLTTSLMSQVDFRFVSRVGWEARVARDKVLCSIILVGRCYIMVP